MGVKCDKQSTKWEAVARDLQLPHQDQGSVQRWFFMDRKLTQQRSQAKGQCTDLYLLEGPTSHSRHQRVSFVS